MGGGIAICFANAGIPVTLLDADDAALERGLANVERTYQSMVDRGRLTAADKAQRHGADTHDARLRATLRDADVIVEAVFESMDLKREVFAKLDAVAQARRDARHQHLHAGHRDDRECHLAPRRT